MLSDNSGEVMISRNGYLPENTSVRPFNFRQRIEKVDWRRLASIDVNQVISQVDIDTLQETLSSVAFCDITHELDMRYADSNLIKLFQLAQLIVEYLLHSQDYLISTLNALKEEKLLLQKDLSKVKQDLAEKTSKLTAVRRECHRRRLLLLAQQQLMDTGPQSYHRCIHCPKAFLNASFLAAHVHRRHPETQNFAHPTLFPASGPTTTGVIAESEQTKKSDLQSALENDVRELLTYLRTHSLKSEAIMSNQNQQPERTLKLHPELVEGVDQLPHFEPPPIRESAESNWKTAVLEENRRELNALQRRFENQLQTLHKQCALTQADLTELKLIPVNSNVGEIVDDVIISSIRRDGNVGLRGQSRFSFPAQTCQRFEPPPQASIETVVGGTEVNLRTPGKLPIDDPSATPSTLLSGHSKTSPVVIAQPAFNNLRKPSMKDVKEGAGDRKTEEEPVLHTVGQVSTTPDEPSLMPCQDLDRSVLHCSQLLEQLKSDPEALQGLRHEVEQLLLEQLTERNIRIGQTRLSTPKLHEYLAALKKDREHLCRKHPGFMETRETLSQHVDRLAHATVGGKQCSRMTSSTFEMGSQTNVKSRSLSRSRLPPLVAFSQGSANRSGSIHSTPQGINIQSPVGQSMPTLSDHGQEQRTAGASKFRSTDSIGITEKRLRLHQPGMQLELKRDDGVQSVFPHTFGAQASRESFEECSKGSPSPDVVQPVLSREHKLWSATNSCSSHQTPVIQYSHDQRVVTFGSVPVNERQLSATNSEDWDSSTQDLEVLSREQEKSKSLADQRTQCQEAILKAEPHENTIPIASQSSNLQQNTNARVTVPTNAHTNWSKTQSIRTDEEELGSVSSLNAGGKDDTSLSPPHGTPRMQAIGANDGGTLIDPRVFAAHIRSAVLDQRPKTRIGRHLDDQEFWNTEPDCLQTINSRAMCAGANFVTDLQSDRIHGNVESTSGAEDI